MRTGFAIWTDVRVLEPWLNEVGRFTGRRRDKIAKKYGRKRVEWGDETTFEMHWQGAIADIALVHFYPDKIKLAGPLVVDSPDTAAHDHIIRGKLYETKCNRIRDAGFGTYLINKQKAATAKSRGAVGILCTSINDHPEVATRFRIHGWVAIHRVESFEDKLVGRDKGIKSDAWSPYFWQVPTIRETF